MAATEELAIIVRMKDLASKEFKNLWGQVKTFGNSVKGLFKGLFNTIFSLKGALVAVAGGFSAIRALERAREIESYSIAFESLTKKVGGATAVLEAMRRGTKGTVADMELMATANRAILLGVGESAEQFELFATLARRLGQAVGRDTVDAFNDLTLGIGRQSRMILDNLGLIVKVDAANEAYAASLGKTVNELTDAERRQAFMSATMEAARAKVAELGAETLTLNDAWGRFKAGVQNTVDALLKSLIPTLTRLFDKLGTWVRTHQPEILQFFATVVEAMGKLPAAAAEIAISFEESFGAINAVLKRSAIVRYATIGALDKLGQTLLELTGGSKEAAKAIGDLAKRELDLASDLSDELYEGAEARAAAMRRMASGARDAASGAAAALRDMAKNLAMDQARDALRETEREMTRFGEIVTNVAPRASSAMNDLTESLLAWIAARRAGQDPAALDWLTDFYRKVRTADAPPPLELTVKEEPEKLDYLEELANRRRELIGLLEEEAATADRSGLSRANVDEAQIIRLERMKNSAAGLRAAFETLSIESENWGKATYEATLQVADAIAGGLAAGIVDIASNFKNAGQAAAEMGKRILQSITEIILQMLILKAVQSGLGALGLGAPAAKGAGGIVPGHLVPSPILRGHAAQGMLVQSRGYYELAERGFPEAVIPLQGGSVPVRLQGPAGAAPGRTVNIINNMSFTHNFARPSDEREMLERNKDLIADVVVRKQNSSLRFREAMA